MEEHKSKSNLENENISNSNSDDISGVNENVDWEDASMEEEMDFDGSTSRGMWEKIRHRADKILKGSINVAEDVAHLGKAELELASLRLRRNKLYAKIGELVFRLKVGEEEENPTETEEVQVLFHEVHNILQDIGRERQKIESIKSREFRKD